MLTRLSDPSETYRRIELDARVEGADGIELTRLCLERAIEELGRAENAHKASNQLAMVGALTRASSGIDALIVGVDKDNPLREPLVHLYSSAAHAVRASISTYRQGAIERVRADLADILSTLNSGI